MKLKYKVGAEPKKTSAELYMIWVGVVIIYSAMISR